MLFEFERFITTAVLSTTLIIITHSDCGYGVCWQGKETHDRPIAEAKKLSTETLSIVIAGTSRPPHL